MSLDKITKEVSVGGEEKEDQELRHQGSQY